VTKEERRRVFLRRSSPYLVVLMPHVRRHRRCFPGYWCCARRAARSSAARTAIAAGSSTRSGSPCRSRERRASSAPVLRIAARSSGLSGPRGGRRTSRLLALLHLTSASGSGMAGVVSVRGHHLPSNDSQERHRLPSAARKDHWGRQNKRPPLPGSISRCNQILTKLASLPAAPKREGWRLTSCDRL
jgi:hypothetical protein